VGAIGRLRRGKEVEQQRRQAGGVQPPGHEPVSRAPPAAAAPVGEHHDAAGRAGDAEVPVDRRGAGVDLGLPLGNGDGAGQDAVDLLVRHLVEIDVPLADGEEQRRRRQADHVVGLCPERLDRLRRAHRDGDDDARRTGPARPPRRRDHRRARGEAVVDEDARPAGDVDRGTEFVQAAIERARLVLGQGHGPAHVGRHQVELVADVDAARRDGPDRQLGLQRMAHLPHGQRVEREAERAGDLGRHHHTAAGEPDDHPVGEPLGREPVCQLPSGVAAVCEGDVARPGAHRPSCTSPAAWSGT
jgi:hypothetical protein